MKLYFLITDTNGYLSDNETIIFKQEEEANAEFKQLLNTVFEDISDELKKPYISVEELTNGEYQTEQEFKDNFLKDGLKNNSFSYYFNNKDSGTTLIYLKELDTDTMNDKEVF